MTINSNKITRNIRDLLKKSNLIIGLVRDIKQIASIPKIFSKKIKDKKIIKNYITKNNIKKIQIGSGLTHHIGWLSTDVLPISENIIFLDATRKFPFDDNVFDYVYSEHMIEHISWHEGVFMLCECFRILKPGGSIRIATPDLAVLTNLYNPDNEFIKKDYIKWITDIFIPQASEYKAAFVLNNAFYNWGHKFIYDGELMWMTLRKAGFIEINKCSYGESNDHNLRNLECHGENAKNIEMVSFETMIYEGRKPYLEPHKLG